jgi:hypothetical protein
MKVSQWLREWQISGRIPDWPDDDPQFAFWCGWLVGAHGRLIQTQDQSREMAIKAAEFIEAQR